MASSFGKDWIAENQRRVKLLSIWYLEDGRDNPEHPKHGLYTGLAILAREGKLSGVLADTGQSTAPLNNGK
jgi:hypothetical protein